MSRGTTWTRVRNFLVPAVAAASMAFAQLANAAGVVINMPAPSKKTPVAVEGAPKSASAANAAPAERVDPPKPDVGQVALSRYVNARTQPYDTYDFGMPYYRYNYNYGYYGYPWFWGFPSIGCFGNQFFGFVGCPSPCTNVVMKTSVLHH